MREWRFPTGLERLDTTSSCTPGRLGCSALLTYSSSMATDSCGTGRIPGNRLGFCLSKNGKEVLGSSPELAVPPRRYFARIAWWNSSSARPANCCLDPRLRRPIGLRAGMLHRHGQRTRMAFRECETRVGLAASDIVGSGIRWIARILFPLTIVQLVLGAHLRHALPTWQPTLFVSFVHTHLLFATLITFLILAAVTVVHLPKYRHLGVRAPARWLSVLLVVQVGLGLGTWVANYALPWPEWNAFFCKLHDCRPRFLGNDDH